MKKIAVISALVLLILFANVFYVSSGLYENDIKKCDAELLFKTDSLAMSSDVLYFGESSDFTYSKNDSVKKSISELIQQGNSSLKIRAIHKGAIHAGIYKTLIERLPENSNIKCVIVTVNLRSFGINWIESDLETNLSRANLLYKKYPPIVKKFCLSFKCYDNTELFKRKNKIKWHNKHDTFKLINLPYQRKRQSI